MNEHVNNLSDDCEVEPLEPGVYFGLPEERYHADPALGSTDIRRLYADPPSYWWQSPHNPDCPEDKPNQDQFEGRAFHVALLEGKGAYLDRYIIEPEKRQYKNLLVTVDDMRQFLKRRGLSATGKKQDIIHQVKAVKKDARIWDDIIADFERRAAEKNLTPINKDLSAHIRAACEHIHENPNLKDVFGNGVPEVTVVWRELQVTLKARIDYLRVRPLLDLKTTRKPRTYMPFDQHVFFEMRNHRHDIQAHHLLTARHAAALAIGDGRVFGDDLPSNRWLDAVADEQGYSAFFIYYQKNMDGPPIAKAYEFKPDVGIMTLASENWKSGISNFITFKLRFGLDEMWVNYDGVHVVQMNEVHKI